MGGPLEGVRILDLATIIAGPFAATLLADYGADVVKAELPGVGDGLRSLPPIKDGKSLLWKVVNRNKRFISLDIRKPEGLAIFKRLLGDFDVLIENFRPGTLDKWGLTKEVLWKINPRLVILRATAFGQTGPYASRPGLARTFEAMGGLAYISGDPAGKPMHPGYPIGDAVGGLFGALSVVSALLKRKGNEAAKGEEIDLSLTEATLRLLDFLVIEYDQLGKIRERAGNATQYSAPTDVYKSMDGHWVSLTGGVNSIFANNCRAIGREDLIDDPRFRTNELRVKNAAAVERIFEDWCQKHSLQEILERFTLAGGTISPVYSVDQIIADPQMIDREAIVTVSDDDFGKVRMQGIVPRFIEDPVSVRSTGRSIGENNAEIYEAIGLGVDARKQLASDGVI